jgi:hypothetical protein
VVTKKEPESPVAKAIRAMLKQAAELGQPAPEALIVHPSMLPSLSKVTGGPLVRAMQAEAAKQGQRVAGVSWDEQHAHDKSELEKQLEDSLWALATGIVPATTATLNEHLPHLAGSRDRVRRLYEGTVLILCPCRTVLRFYRCKYSGLASGRCEEEVRVTEGGSALCSLHR